MKPEDLTEELKAKVAACKTTEELLAIAKGEGYELSDAELEAVSGGSWSSTCNGWTYPSNEGICGQLH